MPEYGSVVERRAFPRYSLHLTGVAEALFRRQPTALEGEELPDEMGKYPIDIVNMSKGGVQLTFNVAFDAHDVLRMNIIHPETDQPIRLEGELMWVRKNATDLMGKFYAGLAFRDTTQEGVDSLVTYASRQGPPLTT